MDECSNPPMQMSDQAAVACMGVHLNGIVALPHEIDVGSDVRCCVFLVKALK